MSKTKSRFGVINLVCLLFAIGVLVILSGDLYSAATALTKYEKCTAEITGTFDFSGARSSRTGAEVKYLVGGKYFKARIEHYESSWKIGKDINIYYNPDNPTEVVSMDEKSGRIFRYLFIELVFIVGAVFYDSNEERRKSRAAWKNSRLYSALNKQKEEK